MIYPATFENIQAGAKQIRQNELCAFPTETVYGLGANALSEEAIAKIYKAKGRPASNPLIVHTENAQQAWALSSHVPDYALELARLFWPGPLTLVLPRTMQVPAQVSAGLHTVALRVPNHPVALKLLSCSQLPICAPSANRSEQLSPTRADHVAQSLPEVAFVLDGGPCAFGIESTVIDLSQPKPTLLRPGALPLRKLYPHVPNLVVPAVDFSLAEDIPRAAPGLMKRHYAPKAKLVLFSHPSEIDPRSTKEPVGLLTHNPNLNLPLHPAKTEILPDDAMGYAADLYAALHRLDDAGMQSILVFMPPLHPDWLAIHDRLLRATATS